MTFAFIFISVFVAVGVGILGYGAWSARRSMEVSNWPIAPGQIGECSMKETYDSDSGTSYQVQVRYSYHIGSKPYTGSRIAYGYAASNVASTHRQLLDTLGHCRSVDVRYNPTDPSVSALSFGLHRSIQFMLIFGAVWLLFSLGMMALMWTGFTGSDVLLKNLSVH